jgi:hypothetical protein
MMTADQSYEANKAEFIARLIEAGWPEAEAEAEWQNVQDDTEGEL